MIYVSSSCVTYNNICDSVQDLVNNGFKNIELSGGTEYHNNFENDILELKEKYNLNFICHNYFPPPKDHFVLNLASLDNNIYNKTFNHLKKAIELSKKLGAKKFGFHAGFFVDIKVNQIGKKIAKEKLADKWISTDRFCDGFNKLECLAGNLKLYVENNVFSAINAETYNSDNFFMLTNYKEYNILKKKINFSLLLDIAHLKVSANSLGINFEKELELMLSVSDYVHISDNNALHDLNHKLQKPSILVELLSQVYLKNKDFSDQNFESEFHYGYISLFLEGHTKVPDIKFDKLPLGDFHDVELLQHIPHRFFGEILSMKPSSTYDIVAFSVFRSKEKLSDNKFLKISNKLNKVINAQNE